MARSRYLELMEEQDRLYDEVVDYIYFEGIYSQVRDDAPTEIKEKFNRMIALTPEIQVAKLFA